MNTQDTTENNKLITEFMGWKIAVGTKDEYTTPHAITKYIDTPMFSHNYNDKELSVEKDHKLDEMLFSTSWDWLMPVVEKIEFLNYSIQTNSLADQLHLFKISSGGAEVLSTRGNTRKETTYKAVIIFIKWYNLKNK